jgi:D-amino-acid dehydrogenase
MHVIVVGAGLIGCATAYQLLRDGHTVELIESQSNVGMVSSFANGAQLSYSYVQPLASPATLRSLPSLLLEKEATLKFRPRWELQQWRWGLQFVRACTQARVQEGTLRLLQLAQRSRLTLEQWLAEEKEWDIGFARNGKLVLCRDQRSLDAQAAQVQLQAPLLASWGHSQNVMSWQDCLHLAPALAKSQTHYTGGVWTDSECVADPHRLCEALLGSILARGGRVHFNQQLVSIQAESGKFKCIQTHRSVMKAQACVIAAGTRSAAMVKALGIHLPIYPIKGYSLTLPVKPDAELALCSITDMGLKTVFAPLRTPDGRTMMRIAAAAELVGEDFSLSLDRSAQMQRAVQALYPDVCDFTHPQLWAGLRPATPDSVPILMHSQISGLFINAGQGALGLTLAAGSAKEIADMMTNEEASISN